MLHNHFTGLSTPASYLGSQYSRGQSLLIDSLLRSRRVPRGASGRTSTARRHQVFVGIIQAACPFYSEPRAVFSVLHILNSCKPRIKNCGMFWRRELNTNPLPGFHLSSAAIDSRKCGIRCSLTPSRVFLIMSLHRSLRLSVFRTSVPRAVSVRIIVNGS